MRRILALVLAAGVLFAIAGHLEAVNVPPPPAPTAGVAAPSAVGSLQTARTGCYANLYNRRGAYAVCTTKGTVFRSWSVCSDGKMYYGPWIRSTGYNQSGVWCRTPYRVLKQGYQRSAVRYGFASTRPAYAGIGSCTYVQFNYVYEPRLGRSYAVGAQAWCGGSGSWRVVVGCSHTINGPATYTTKGAWTHTYWSVRRCPSNWPYAQWASFDHPSVVYGLARPS